MSGSFVALLALDDCGKHRVEERFIETEIGHLLGEKLSLSRHSHFQFQSTFTSLPLHFHYTFTYTSLSVTLSLAVHSHFTFTFTLGVLPEDVVVAALRFSPCVDVGYRE